MTNKQEQEHHGAIQVAGYLAAITLAFAALIFVYFFSLDGASIARISRPFFIEIDLEKCQLNFSRLLMTQTAFSVAVGIALLFILLLAIADIYTFKRKPNLYGKLLLVLALFSLVFLSPLISGEGAWMSGGRKGLSRVSLDEACIGSQQVTYYRAYVIQAVMIFFAWSGLNFAFVLRSKISLGQDPNQLSDKPEVRALQLKLEKSSQARMAALKLVSKLVICVLAAVVFVVSSSSLSYSFWRAYHTLTWPRQQTTIVAVGTECFLEKKHRRSAWTRHSVIACSQDANEVMRRARTLEDEVEWRVTEVPTAELRYQAPDGRIGTLQTKGNFFIPTRLPVGSEVTFLRNPENSGNFDRIFERRDAVKSLMQLLAIILPAAIIYFLLIRRPRKGNMAKGGVA